MDKIPEFPMMSPNDLYNKKGSFDDVTEEETLAVARYHAKHYNSPQGGMIYNVETGEIYEVSDMCSDIQCKYKTIVGQASSMELTSMQGFKILWTYEDYETVLAIKEEQDDVAEVATEEPVEQPEQMPKETPAYSLDTIESKLENYEGQTPAAFLETQIEYYLTKRAGAEGEAERAHYQRQLDITGRALSIHKTGEIRPQGVSV